RQEEEGEEQTEDKSWFYYLFAPLRQETTELLDKTQAKFQEQLRNKNLSLDEMLYAKDALHNINSELFMRKHPQARETNDTWKAINKKKSEARRKWEKEIIAREGEEGLQRRIAQGEEPPSCQYMPEELDAFVNF